jgi:hypothetical protein
MTVADRPDVHGWTLEHPSLFRAQVWQFLRLHGHPELPAAPTDCRTWAGLDAVSPATLRAGLAAFDLVVGLDAEEPESQAFELAVLRYFSDPQFRLLMVAVIALTSECGSTVWDAGQAPQQPCGQLGDADLLQ